MRVAVTGASGNLGTSVLKALADVPEVESVVGVARRRPSVDFPKVTWATANVAHDDLMPAFEGVDAVVHLAWAIQPSRDEALLQSVNVDGSRRVLEAAAACGAGAFVHASSVGAYAAIPRSEAERRVDESYPASGIDTSIYSRQKAEVESALDEFERGENAMRVVRMRPALIFKREAGAEIRRLFCGPFFPNAVLRKWRPPVVPVPSGLRMQCVHADDVGRAFAQAVIRDVHGAFNVAAEPQLSAADLARIVGGRPVEVSPRALRALAYASWRARLQPTPPGWLDLAMGAPGMDASRARAELGWEPRKNATDTLCELIEGLADGAGAPTPPLDPQAGGRWRGRELRTGVGGRP